MHQYSIQNIIMILILLNKRFKTCSTTRLLYNLTLIALMNKDNKVKKCSGSKIFKKLAKF